MNEQEYRTRIHGCTMTFEEHVKTLGLCWSVLHNYNKPRAVEGPQECQQCELGIKANRLEDWRRCTGRFSATKMAAKLEMSQNTTNSEG